jgi:hypothetical protein
LFAELLVAVVAVAVIAETKMYSSRVGKGLSGGETKDKEKEKSSADRTEQNMLDSITEVFGRVRALSAGGFALVPGGWVNPNGEGGRNIMFVVQRKESTFSLGVCNTSADAADGLRYHPVLPDSTPDLQYKLTLVVEDIPLQRLLDSSFWLLNAKMQFQGYEAKRGAEFLYEHLLPFLNGKPVQATIVDNNEDKKIAEASSWTAPPRNGERGLIRWPCQSRADSVVHSYTQVISL